MNIVATLEHQLTVHSLFRLPERQVINAIMPHAQMLERSISLTTKNIDCLMLDNKKSYRANELKTIQIQSLHRPQRQDLSDDSHEDEKDFQFTDSEDPRTQ